MAVKKIVSAQWGDISKTRIYGVAKIDGVGGDWPFAVFDGYDTERGQEIWNVLRDSNFQNVAEYSEPEPETAITVIPAVTLWERMTEAEAEQVAEVMKTQSVRTVQIFNNATTFRSDHELWPLLEQIAHDLFGAARASELLAP